MEEMRKGDHSWAVKEVEKCSYLVVQQKQVVVVVEGSLIER